jgi:dihydrofolate reductase
MRRIVMFNRVTAEGYFAGADGNLDWVVPDREVDRIGAEATGAYDTVLLGRRTYELFDSFWPHALDDSDSSSDPHGSGARSPEMRAMAVMLNESTKLVFSKTLKSVMWKNSLLRHELDPGEIETLKREPGKDMIVLGSGSIVSQLTQHGLIDEYQIIVSSVLIGSGRPLLSDAPTNRALELQEAKKYPSGNVMLRYSARS